MTERSTADVLEDQLAEEGGELVRKWIVASSNDPPLYLLYLYDREQMNWWVEQREQAFEYGIKKIAIFAARQVQPDRARYWYGSRTAKLELPLRLLRVTTIVSEKETMLPQEESSND